MRVVTQRPRRRRITASRRVLMTPGRAIHHSAVLPRPVRSAFRRGRVGNEQVFFLLGSGAINHFWLAGKELIYYWQLQKRGNRVGRRRPSTFDLMDSRGSNCEPLDVDKLINRRGSVSFRVAICGCSVLCRAVLNVNSLKKRRLFKSRIMITSPAFTERKTL